MANPARLTQTEQEQNVNRQIERLEDERNQALRERDHYRETVHKLREVIKDAGSGEKPVSCKMFGHYAHNTILCSRCKVKQECEAWKEAV